MAAGDRYGCPIDAVREIIPYRAATRLPGAPAHVVGLINLRGRLVAVSDFAVHVGGRDGAAARRTTWSIILVQSGARMVGVLVDEVRDVRPVRPDAIEPIQRHAAASGVLNALARFDDGPAVVLDADAFVAHVLQ